MAQKWAIANQKGGTGKTTTACALAVGWARQLEERVLLVDCDPQSNSSLTLCREPEIEPNLADVLAKDGLYPLADVIRTVEPRLDVLPGGLALALTEAQLPALIGGQTRLRAQLAQVESTYAVILLDLPPGLGALCLNGLAAADQVIIPILAGEYSIKGLRELVRTVESVVRNLNRGLLIRGILLNQTDRTLAVQATRERLAVEFPGLLLRTEIPRSTKIVEASAPGLSVFDHPNTPAAVAFASLLMELSNGG